MLTLFLSFVCCGGMLKDFFNTSSNHYIYYKNDVINYLKQCLPSYNVSEWEESVRVENMSEGMCSLSSSIKNKCMFTGKMNSSVEYYKLLLSDADFLCGSESNGFNMFFIIIVILVLVLVLMLALKLLKLCQKSSPLCHNCQAADTLYLFKYCKENVSDVTVSRDTVNE